MTVAPSNKSGRAAANPPRSLPAMGWLPIQSARPSRSGSMSRTTLPLTLPTSVTNASGLSASRNSWTSPAMASMGTKRMTTSARRAGVNHELLRQAALGQGEGERSPDQAGAEDGDGAEVHGNFSGGTPTGE